MKRYVWLTCALLAFAANTGCVERRFLVTSQVPGLPPGADAGAMVFVNGEPRGATPVDVYYTYYGNYHITLVKDGYETLQVDQPVCSPWYEWPPIDFITENIYPFRVRDLRTFNYLLQPAQSARAEDVLNRGTDLRARGQTIVPIPGLQLPQPKPAPPPTVPGTVPPVPPVPPG